MKPINKKYFGNRNIGVGGNQVDGNESNSQNYADDRIGGEGLLGVAFGAHVPDHSYGSGAYLNRKPSIVSIGAPQIPGGVQAVATVHEVGAVHGVVHDPGTPNGADYLVGDILTAVGGTGTAATYTVESLKVSGFTIVAGNDGNTGHGYAVGDPLNFANGVVLTVATISGNGSGGYPSGYGPVTSATLTNRGNYTSLTPPPTGTVGHTNPLGGQGFTVNFSWGVSEVSVLDEGAYTAVSATPVTTTVIHSDETSSSATGCTLDVYYGIQNITVSQRGSGYTGAEAITFTVQDDGLSETRATGTITLTADVGDTNASLNPAGQNENAIIIHANTDDAGTKIGDIIKQTNGRSYKVRTADGYAVCKLVADDTPNYGEASIIATDSGGSTYWVTKLQGRKCSLKQRTTSGSYLFEDGFAPWKLFEGTTAQPGYVKIENA